jgi:thioredoxin reductase
LGGIATDSFGRTNITGVYAAGDASFAPGQLIIAASEGSRAAVGVNMYLTQRNKVIENVTYLCKYNN